MYIDVGQEGVSWGVRESKGNMSKWKEEEEGWRERGRKINYEK